jgi:hypothetical protein
MGKNFRIGNLPRKNESAALWTNLAQSIINESKSHSNQNLFSFLLSVHKIVGILAGVNGRQSGQSVKKSISGFKTSHSEHSAY